VVVLQTLGLGKSEVQYRSVTNTEKYSVSCVKTDTSLCFFIRSQFVFIYLNSKFNIATLYSLPSIGHLYSRRLPQLEATAEYKSSISLLPCNVVRPTSSFFYWCAFSFTRMKTVLSMSDNVKFVCDISDR